MAGGCGSDGGDKSLCQSSTQLKTHDFAVAFDRRRRTIHVNIGVVEY